MRNSNPYASSDSISSDADPTARRSKLKRFLFGFLAGASIPCLLGVYGLYQFNVYAASIPPGQAVCGTPAIGPFLLIMFVGPTLGVLSGLVALVIP